MKGELESGRNIGQENQGLQRDQGGIIPYPVLTVDGKCFLALKPPRVWYAAEEIKAVVKG